MMVYLDNAATTQMSSSALEAMLPYLRDNYGNPGAKYSLGAEAKKAVDTAREQVASLFHATPDHIIFTGGGSEANNLMIKGSVDPSSYKKVFIATGKTEHSSMHKAIDDVSFIPLEIDEEFLFNEETQSVIKENSVELLSMMYVNNETGEINNVEEIGKYCQEHNIRFGTDCVQAAGALDLDTTRIPADYMSISSHKIHGPKGVGALYVRDLESLHPLICGGKNQEFGLRGGTENVAGIVGFGKAAELALKYLKVNAEFIANLNTAFINTLWGSLNKAGISGILHINKKETGRVYSNKIINIRFEGIDGETLLLLLDREGIFLSAGSACNARVSTPSRTLKAMGLTDKEAANSIRVSFSSNNTLGGVEYAAKKIVEIVVALKKVRK